LLFLGFSIVQWLGKDLVHTRVLPGTLAPHRTLDLTIQLGFYILFFFCALDYFNSRKKIAVFTGFLWVQLGLLVAVGFLQGFGPYKVSDAMYKFIQMPYDLKSFYASFPNPNHTGAYFSIASSFLIISVIYSIENLKRNELDGQELLKACAYFLLLPTMILSEIYSQARTGFFLHLIYVLLFTLVAVPKKHRLTALMAIMLLGVTYLFLMKSSPIVFPLEPFFKDIHKGLNYRFAIAGDAIHIFFNYPVFGTGFGSSKYVSAIYQKLDPEQFQWYGIINHHLELLFSSGLIGYLLFLAPIVSVILYYRRRTAQSESYFVKIYGLGAFLAILLTGTLGSYVDDFLRVPAVAVLFIAHLAILVNAGTEILVREAEPYPRPKGRLLFFVFGLFVLAALGFFAGITYASQKNMIDARNTDVSRLEKAVMFRPDNAEAWVRLGLAYQNRSIFEVRSGYDGSGSTTKATQAHEEAVKIAPLWSDAWLNLGQAQIFAGEYQEGLASLRRAIELSPYNRDYRVYVLSLHLRVANLTSDPQLKSDTLKAARNVVDGYRGKGAPITVSDYGYVGDLNRRHFKLSPQDEIRIRHFFQDLDAMGK
jgi:hypothetical protein